MDTPIERLKRVNNQLGEAWHYLSEGLPNADIRIALRDVERAMDRIEALRQGLLYEQHVSRRPHGLGAVSS